MKGIQHITVSNSKVQYKFDLYRNITIVKGDSGTGKTTLYDMIAEYARYKDKSGINLQADKQCVALTDSDWQNQLNNTKDSIVFIDEGTEFILSKDFARHLQNSDNYYVIFNRQDLYNLPYSVTEIYRIKTSRKFHTFEKIYTSDNKFIYQSPNKQTVFDTLLTEDSQSGFQFFEKHFENTLTECISAGSNSNIYKFLTENKNKKIFIIADGAAFGAYISKIKSYCEHNGNNISLCLPESFEWLILKSGILKLPDLNEILSNPSNYIESSSYFSWERFFEDYLKTQSKNKPFRYSKSSINGYYTSSLNSNKIITIIATDNIK